jgi:calcineurin-like phosphoesterase family protein
MQTWITSDLHVGHVKIIEYCDRPFKDVPEMNEALVTTWNETVGPNDMVYVLGDAAMGKLDDSLPILGQMQGRKILIPGNHDRLHPMYKAKKDYLTWERRYRMEAAFETIWPVETWHHLVDGGDRVKWCHFPYMGDSHDEDRFDDWRPKDTGEWLIHGHVHDTWRQNGRMINVGIDAWGGRILSIEEVADMVDRAVPQRLERIPW